MLGDPIGRILGQTFYQSIEAECVLVDVLGVVQALGDDDVHHPQRQGGVGAGHWLHVPVGGRCRPSLEWIDDHDGGAVRFRFPYQGPQVQVRDDRCWRPR